MAFDIVCPANRNEFRNRPSEFRDRDHLATGRFLEQPVELCSSFIRTDRSHGNIVTVAEEATVELFRPVGPRELARIHELGDRAFPPRLPSQPIFYPVVNEFYARKIARDWNATKADTGYRGYVTRFLVRADYASRFDVQTVGASWAKELWVPAEALEEFNSNIVGGIEVIAEYDGSAGGESREVPAGVMSPEPNDPS